MMRRLLVPLDGSDFSEHALPLAVALARPGGLVLRLLHVHQPLATPGPALPSAVPLPLHTSDAEAHAAALHYLEECAAKVHAATGMQPHVEVAMGSLTSTLVNAIAEAHTDLVIMTTHGRGGLARAWLGSTADGVVRHSTVPVLLVRPAAELPDLSQGKAPRRILVPLDGTLLSERILPHAVELARPGGATLVLGAVVGTGASSAYALPHAPVQAASPEAAAQTYLHAVRERFERASLDVTIDVRRSANPAAGIHEAARAHDADVICMATHGRGTIGRALLGSVADRVLHSCELPLLLYRPT